MVIVHDLSVSVVYRAAEDFVPIFISAFLGSVVQHGIEVFFYIFDLCISRHI